jgi:hypothetical protein
MSQGDNGSMLMGTGLLSKFVELVASKLIGKRLDIALDEKRRACYSFVELLSILKGFHSITEGFIQEIDQYEGESWVTINLLAIHRQTVQSLTTRFFVLNNDLFLTLDVLDPALAEIFSQIHTFKGSIFYALADSITIPEEEPRNQSIVYRHASDRVLAIDMEAFYRSLQGLRKDDQDRPWIWPVELAEVADWQAAFPSIQFKTNDIEELKRFVNDLRGQLHLLKMAVDQLRTLIKDNFTLDEVLASSRKLADG